MAKYGKTTQTYSDRQEEHFRAQIGLMASVLKTSRDSPDPRSPTEPRFQILDPQNQRIKESQNQRTTETKAQHNPEKPQHPQIKHPNPQGLNTLTSGGAENRGIKGGAQGSPAIPRSWRPIRHAEKPSRLPSIPGQEGGLGSTHTGNEYFVLLLTATHTAGRHDGDDVQRGMNREE
ncbi:hypothetical protein N7462_002843 [Penicillium macrosclerotiorum]|uniref:uncharacterized protein n=1 Tax=Penicillium macrosclerotiorum TaxID=303699 RepID=UPI0025494860|nr:uncharacterized protein N7462_002843 [Penicillium macrosclerotiorum]KAJ5693420.1 hypothetical protein N7462_002843 [Penicillium macrosclerotiorum]